MSAVVNEYMHNLFMSAVGNGCMHNNNLFMSTVVNGYMQNLFVSAVVNWYSTICL